jgi:hypothetical protein
MVLKCRKRCIRNRKSVKEEYEEIVVFQVETVTGQIYPIWTRYVRPELDMSDLDSFKAKIIVTFGSDCNF